MFSSVHITSPSRPSAPSSPVIIFECPHASSAFPEGYPTPPNLKSFEEHQIWDPGAAVILDELQKHFPQAWFIRSTTSRLLADHNRTVDACVTPGFYSEEDTRRIISDLYWPYIREAQGVVDKALDNRQFPMFFNVHTYDRFNPKNKSEERMLFSVGGDPDSVIVRTLYERLIKELQKPEIIEQLEALGLKQSQFLYPINQPFDFMDPKIYKENMAARYSLRDSHPWVHWETRNDYATKPEVLGIIGRIYEAVLADPAVLKDWKARNEAYFMHGPDVTMRPQPLGLPPHSTTLHV